MKRALSSALLTYGVEDQLLDDGAMTATKWLMADGHWPGDVTDVTVRIDRVS